MTENPDRTAQPLNWGMSALRWGLLAGALLYVAVYVGVAAARMGYPYELEWTEGRMADHVARIVAGEKAYVRPALEFKSVGYPFLYYYVSAAAAKVTGVSIFPLRLVAFLSSLGSLALIFLFVRRETKDWYAGALGACFFAAAYKLSGGYYDVARCDSLLVALLLAGLYVVRFYASWPATALAALLFSLAMLTKQTALLVTLAALPWCFVRDWRKGAAMTLAIGAITGGSILIMDAVHDGWYRYFTLTAIARHTLREGEGLRFWTRDLLTPLPVAFAMSLFFLGRLCSPSRWRDGVFYVCTTGSLVFVGWIGIWSDGGDRNALIPTYAAAALLFGLSFHAICDAARNRPRRQAIAAALYVLCLFQMVLLVYNPKSFIPTKEDREAGRRLVETMRGIQGEVWLTFHGYLPTLAGKHNYAPSYDYTAYGDPTPEQQVFQEEVRQAVRNHKFAAIITNGHTLRKEWEPYYRFDRPVFDSPDAFYPVVGYQTRPKSIFVPRRDSENPGTEKR